MNEYADKIRYETEESGGHVDLQRSLCRPVEATAGRKETLYTGTRRNNRCAVSHSSKLGERNQLPTGGFLANSCQSLRNFDSRIAPGGVTTRRGSADTLILQFLVALIVGILLTASATAQRELRRIREELQKQSQYHSTASPATAPQETPSAQEECQSEPEEPPPAFEGSVLLPDEPPVPVLFAHGLPDYSASATLQTASQRHLVYAMKKQGYVGLKTCSYRTPIDSLAHRNRQFPGNSEKIFFLKTLENIESSRFLGEIFKNFPNFPEYPVDKHRYSVYNKSIPIGRSQSKTGLESVRRTRKPLTTTLTLVRPLLSENILPIGNLSSSLTYTTAQIFAQKGRAL